MENTETNYKIIKGTAANGELENYRLCFEKNGTNRDMNNLVWLHLKNLPHDHAIYYAMAGEEIAAIYTALPLIFKIGDSLFPALQSIDTLTDADHRSKGLFIRLANTLHDEAPQHKYALIYGFPNENSAPGFFKKLKWTSFGEAPFLLKPLNPFYFIKKILKRKQQTDFSGSDHIFEPPAEVAPGKFTLIKPLQRFDNDYDMIWKKVSMDIKVCVDRSAAYMNWRYVQKPGEHYYRFGLYTNDKLGGIIIFSVKNKHDGLIGYVMELVFDPGDVNIGRQLLKFSSRLFKAQRVDVILAWCLPGSFNYTAYKKSGYYKLPEKLRPQKLFLGFRVFDSSKLPLVKNIRNWYISYSDSDTS